MSERRIVPIAYVTTWATTAGIRIVRDAEVTESNALSKGHLYVSATDWSEDKAEAEARCRSKLDAAIKSAERKVDKLRKAYLAEPKYTEG